MPASPSPPPGQPWPEPHPLIGYVLRDVCSILDISTTTANRMVESGELETFKLGRFRRVTPEALKRCIEGLEQKERDRLARQAAMRADIARRGAARNARAMTSPSAA